jgi:F-type H+-transporting ATPase subunit epsilon
MAGVVRVEVVTPERLVWSGPAEMVIARGVEGELGVLPHHAPLITALLDSPLEIRLPGGARTVIAVRGGFLEVKPDRVTVLADEAELPEEEGAVAAEHVAGAPADE